MATKKPTDLPALTAPGHYIRRLQQIAVALFLDECAGLDITPVQYAALQAIANSPGVDQKALARGIGYDTSTIGGVIDRLAIRGWVQRDSSPVDRRLRLLTVTPEGKKHLQKVIPRMEAAQLRILAPLPARERTEFMRMLRLLVEANNDVSRAPRE
jgi:MarR family transcriptional regulator, lower aerobic nicotinate degradation pathway regulator